MNIREATAADEARWDAIARPFGRDEASSATGSFLQSWQWGEMQGRLGVRYWRFIVEDQGAGVAAALVLRRDLPFGQNWLYAPRGPVISGADTKMIWQILQTRLQQLAHEQKSMFVRIDPPWQSADSLSELVVGRDWKKSEREVQPRHTLLLDLTPPLDQILARMHAKTRYNIGLAERKGVTVRFSREVADLSHFFSLALEVMRRSRFSYHAHEYYEAMIEVLGTADMGDLALAEYQGEVLAAHILLTYGSTMVYAHGASSVSRRELMAPYLLQWESIKLAKERGCLVFDFFGVAPADASSQHAWAGITRFKTGFSGQRADYIGAYDLVINPARYALFNMARRAREVTR